MKPDAAPVRFDDPQADGETEAQALLLRGRERPEQVADAIRWNPRSIVHDTDFHLS
jgi:hypothetical protein